MKVGILSVVPTSGKTTLMELLAGVFTISQRRTAALFSTGDLSDFTSSVETNEISTKPQADVVKAMIESSAGDRLLLDYGTRIGMENVFLYNILGAEMDDDDKIQFLTDAINAVPVDLTLVEITGDPFSYINQNVLKQLDCCFILVYPCWKAINEFREFIKKLPNCMAVDNYMAVAAMIDPRSIGDKKFASLLGIKLEDMLRYPELDVLPKEALAVHLDACCEKIVAGDPQYVQLRQPIYEMMSYIFDTNTYSIIRPIEKWCI